MGTFGRMGYQEILLRRYFKEAVFRLNPWLNDLLYQEALNKLEYRLSSASPMQINEEKYALLRDGIPVQVKQADGTSKERYVMVFDFDEPERNHFLAVKELKIHGICIAAARIL